MVAAVPPLAPEWHQASEVWSLGVTPLPRGHIIPLEWLWHIPCCLPSLDGWWGWGLSQGCICPLPFFHPLFGSSFAAVVLLWGCWFGQSFNVTGRTSPSLHVFQQLQCSPQPLPLPGSLVSPYFLFEESAAASREQLLLRLLTTVPLCNEKSNINLTTKLLQVFYSLAKAKNSGNRTEASFNSRLAATASTMAEGWPLGAIASRGRCCSERTCSAFLSCMGPAPGTSPGER